VLTRAVEMSRDQELECCRTADGSGYGCSSRGRSEDIVATCRLADERGLGRRERRGGLIAGAHAAGCSQNGRSEIEKRDGRAFPKLPVLRSQGNRLNSNVLVTADQWVHRARPAAPVRSGRSLHHRGTAITGRVLPVSGRAEPECRILTAERRQRVDTGLRCPAWVNDNYATSLSGICRITNGAPFCCWAASRRSSCDSLQRYAEVLAPSGSPLGIGAITHVSRLKAHW